MAAVEGRLLVRPFLPLLLLLLPPLLFFLFLLVLRLDIDAGAAGDEAVLSAAKRKTRRSASSCR